MVDIIGCDVSKWQGAVNFTKMAGAARFVIIKMTEGTVADANGAVNWTNSRNKLPRAAYLYFHPELDGTAQANALVKAMGDDFGDFGPCIDLEHPQSTWTAAMLQSLQACLARVEQLVGRKPIIYTGAWYMPYIGQRAWLKDHLLWIASYAGIPTGAPKVPAPWTKHTLWQYSNSGSGPDYGATSAHIDLNAFNGTEQEFAAFIGQAASADTQRTTGAAVVYSAGAKIGGGVSITTQPGDGELLELLSIAGTPVMHGKFVRASLVEAIPQPEPPPARNPIFTATPTSITAGQAVTLAWSATDGANGIYINGVGKSGPSGSEVVRPASTTPYKLTVTYPDSQIIEREITATVTPAPVPTVTKVALGGNVIANGREGQSLIDSGADCVSVTFDPEWGGNVKRNYPALHVAVRGLLDKGYVPTVDQWWGKVWQGAVDGAFLIGLNENDQVGDSAANIRERIAFDRAALAKTKAEAKARGIRLRYCGGGFSVGVPNILDRGIAEAMYGYNELLKDPDFYFNRHLYAADDHGADPARAILGAPEVRRSPGFVTPPEFQALFPPKLTVPGTRDLIFTNDVSDWQVDRYTPAGWVKVTTRTYRVDWTVRRWALDMVICGWDLNMGQKIVCDETGIDVGSVGGFNAVPGCDDAYMQRWARRFVEVSHFPVVVDGKQYQADPLWAAIFALGGHPNWDGYNILTRLGAFTACRWGKA